jgi:hypothetical protein
MNPSLPRPEVSEYPEYYGRYIEQVPPVDPAGGIVRVLAGQIAEAEALFRGLGEERALHRYAPGKWSVKEVLGHLIDSERVFAYRGLRFSRSDATPLPGFDQDAYVRQGRFDARPIEHLRAEWIDVRRASVALFMGWDEASAAGRGQANDIEVTARAIPFIIAGHTRHHLGVLRERYLGS